MATSANDKLLEEIREDWSLDDTEWADIRDEGATDVQCLAGGLWDAMDPKGKKQRKDAVRPIIDLDELTQYCNQVINDLRQNKRGIKVTPKGNGANDQTALFRQSKIRDIEYQSNAHQAYTTMAENAIQRGYGFLRITPQYIGDDFDQELIIEPIVNPDTVTPDCYSVRSDGKDLRRIWVRESRPVNEFQREFPKAEVTDFAGFVEGLSSAHKALATKWMNGTSIDIAECWRKQFIGTRTRLALKPTDPSQPPQKVWKDEAGEVRPDQILKSRDVDQFKVMQYLTNGLEILKTTEWKGQSIPFVCCYGKVIYVKDSGGQTTRKLLSLIRLARSPQMLMAYIATCQAELVGMTPKFPYFYPDGSLSPEALTLLAQSLHEPVAGIPYKLIFDGLPVGTVSPPPTRQPFEPPIQQLEMMKESVRRSIQAAIGATPLPTQAQRRNEKSGVALKQIEDTAQKGSFHFVDHYDEGIARTGVLLDEAIPHYYDTARETSIRKGNDDVAMVRINDPAAKYSPKLEKGDDPAYAHIDTKLGQHDVTISVGPRQDSEREASSDFADTIVNSKIIEMIGPQKGPKLIAQAIRLKNLGPVGDEMADVIDPKDTGQPNPQQAAQMAAENDQLKQQLGEAAKAIETDKIKMDAQIHMKQMDIDLQRDKMERDAETKITVAELTAAVKKIDLFLQERARLGLQSHEVGTQGMAQLHERQMAEDAHQQTLEQNRQAAAHGMIQAEQGQDHALAQGDQAQAGVLAQQQQAADLAPEPAAGA